MLDLPGQWLKPGSSLRLGAKTSKKNKNKLYHVDPEKVAAAMLES